MAEEKRGKAKVVVALVVALALIVTTAVVVRGRSKKTKESQYRTQPADRGNITMTVTATGTVSAVTTVQVGSQVSGVIAGLHADFNSPVKKGQLLAELDPAPFQAQVEQRRADLRRAEVERANAAVNYNRQKRLVESGLISSAELDNARAALDSAAALVDQSAAALSQSESNLRYTKIRSPIDGVVVERQYDIGQTVAASFQAPTLFTIAQDLTKMQVKADIDQADIGRLNVGQTVHFTVDAYPEQTFDGRIADIRLNATTNQNVVTYPVIVEVANEEQRLRPNMTADVTIEVATAEDVLRVPNAALRFRPEEEKGDARASDRRGGGAAAGGAAAGGGAEARGGSGREGAARQGKRGRRGAQEQTVYILVGEELEPRTVITGISDGRFTEVKSGTLREGENVVIGKATSKVDDSSRPPGMGGGRFGGGGRR